MKKNKKLLSVAIFAVFALSLMVNLSSVALAGVGVAPASPITDLQGYGQKSGLGTNDLRTTIMNVVNILMGFLGIIALLITLTGGFKWMTAGGSEEGIEEAKKLITAGIVGMGVILASYAIAFFALSSLITATGGA